jgi:hypothetical protein
MRHIAVFALMTAFLLLFSGCVSKSEPVVAPEVPAVPQAPSAPPITVEKPCSAGNILQKDDCYLALASSRSDPEICKNIYSEATLNACYAQFADSRLEICMRITDGGMRAGCLTANAVREKSEQTCNLVDNPEKREECLRLVLPPCMLISDYSSRLLCLALEKNDYSVCKSDACFFAFAANRSNADACLLINTSADRYACDAVVKKSPALCKEASLVPVQDSCIEKSAYLLGDSGACDLATSGSDYRNRCYAHFAVERRNPVICENAEPESGRDTCYRNYSVVLADTSACAYVKETLNRQGCYYQAAIRNRMPSLCNPFTGQTLREDCYARAIFIDEGPLPSDCPKLLSEQWIGKCYYVAAKTGNNRAYCDLITTDYDKRSCLALFG